MVQRLVAEAVNDTLPRSNGKRQAALALQAAQRSAEHALQTRRLTEQLFDRGRVTQDAIAHSTVMAAREQQAAKERDLDDRVQGWLLYRALKPQEFGERLVDMFVRTGADSGIVIQKWKHN